MTRSPCRKLLAAVCFVAALGAGRVVRADDVLAQISVRGRARAGALHGEMFRFADDVRDYSARSFYGWSFRQELGDDRVRVLEVDRVGTPGAYLMATDLFADGHFSTMSHTVAMLFPRSSAEPYALREDASGAYTMTAPDGAILRIDGRSGALLATEDFSIAPQGPPGTPPRLRHRGLRLEIVAVGKSPFLRRTPARFVDASGAACETTTDELFAFSAKPESDVFRYDTDAALFDYLARRCPRLAIPRSRARVVTASGVPVVPGRSTPPRDSGQPATVTAAPRDAGPSPWQSLLERLASLLSNR